MLCGCTVTPVRVVDRAPSFDGGVRNSGFIGYDSAGNGILTPHARDRYNGLAEKYGKRFIPPTNPNDGITPTPTNTFLIDPEHLVKFGEMNLWRKQDLP